MVVSGDGDFGVNGDEDFGVNGDGDFGVNGDGDFDNIFNENVVKNLRPH